MQQGLVECSPQGFCVQHTEGVLTVNRDFDLALVGRRHTVVGDAFIVLSLLPLDLRDV